MITRDENNKMIGGVCAGIANHFEAAKKDVPVALIRLVFCLAGLLTGVVPMVILYIILWAVMPKGE